MRIGFIGSPARVRYRTGRDIRLASRMHQQRNSYFRGVKLPNAWRGVAAPRARRRGIFLALGGLSR